VLNWDRKRRGRQLSLKAFEAFEHSCHHPSIRAAFAAFAAFVPSPRRTEMRVKKKILLPNYDVLVLKCPESEISEVHAKVVKLMETAVVRSVPLRVNSATDSHCAAM
jgi:hypothetical protein